MSRWIAYKQQMGIPVTRIEKFKSDDVFYVSDVFSTTEFDDIFAEKGYPYEVKNNNGKNWCSSCKYCYYKFNNKLLYTVANEMPDKNFA